MNHDKSLCKTWSFLCAIGNCLTWHTCNRLPTPDLQVPPHWIANKLCEINMVKRNLVCYVIISLKLLEYAHKNRTFHNSDKFQCSFAICFCIFQTVKVIRFCIFQTVDTGKSSMHIAKGYEEHKNFYFVCFFYKKKTV